MTQTPAARRGPRRHAGSARSAILTSARELFHDGDFQSVSLRAVARAAGVDSALVSYYFGTKQQLYTEAMSLPSGPHLLIAQVCAATHPDSLGHDLLATFVAAWDAHVGASGIHGPDPRMQGVVQALLDQPDAFGSVSRFYSQRLVDPVAEVLADRFPRDEARVRACLGLSRLLGIFTTRYVLGLDPLADLPGEELVAREAPGLQATLTGALPQA